MQERELLRRMLPEIPRLQPPLHIHPVPHHAGVRTGYIQQHTVIGLGQPVLPQHQRGLFQQVRLNQSHIHATGPREVLLQPFQPRPGLIHRHDTAGGHLIRNEQALAPRGRAEIEQRLPSLRRQQLDRQTGGRILQVQLARRQQRLDLGPVPRRHAQEAGPNRRLQELRGLARPAPAPVHRRRSLIPFQERAGRDRAELRQPSPHQPDGMRKIFREHGGVRFRRRRGLGEGLREAADDRVHHPSLGRAGERLGAFHRVVHDPRHPPRVSLRRGRRFQQFQPR